MPVRIVCPSCATQLNVRDEHAGRPVKCPKCQYIIPPAQAAPPVIPTGAAPPDVDVHPATPVAAPLPVTPPASPPVATGGLKPARPTPSAPDRGEPPPRPAGRPPRDRDRDRDHDRKWDDDEDDRPRRRPRRRDEDDDTDGDRPKKKGSKVGLLLGIFGGILLVCCGGGGYGIYYAYTKIKEKAQQVTGVLELAVKLPGAWVVDEEASRELRGPGFQGGGFFLTFREDGTAEYGNPQSRSTGRWEIKERSGDMTEVWLRPLNGGPTSYILKLKLVDDDHLEVSQNAYCGGCRMKRAGPVTAADLVKAFKDDPKAAGAKYTDKAVQIEGKVNNVLPMRTGGARIMLDGVPPPADNPLDIGTLVECQLVGDGKTAWGLSRGQTVKVRGTCTILAGPYLIVEGCRIEGGGPDPAIRAQIGPFVTEFKDDPKAAEAKYKGKQVFLDGVIAESKIDAGPTDNPGLIIAYVSKKATGATPKVRAEWPPGADQQLASVKPKDRVKIKGEFAGFSDGTITLKRCWLVP